MNLVFFAVTGERNHLGVGAFVANVLCRLDTIDLWHQHIHQHHMRLKLFRQIQRVFGISSVADDIEFLGEVFEQDDQAFAHHIVIVNDQNADFF